MNSVKTKGIGWRAMRGLALALLLLAPVFAQAFVGDIWRTVRGDRSPGASWQSLTATATGRLIGAGANGYLMISDDAGVTWDYHRMVVNGEAERIGLTDIVEFGVNGSSVQRRIAAVGAWLEEPGTTQSRYVAQTYVFLSDDNGNTWTRHPFPIASVTGTPFGVFEGIDLTRLHVTQGGELLAYGTTTVSQNLFIIWNIGGVIYRSGDGEGWQRSTFELGPLYQMADVSDGDRLVTAGSSTVTDSVDGAGWNGYLMRDANIAVGAGSMDTTTRNRLRLEDVVWHNGTYIAEAATYVPYDDSGTIETSTTDRLFTLSSGAPFSGTRAWNAYEQQRRYGKLLSAGNNLVRAGPSGVYQGSGQAWNWISWNPVASNNALTKTGAGSYFGVGTTGTSQNGDAVWKSLDGLSWDKIYDAGEDPDLYVFLGNYGNTLFACASGWSSAYLWVSTDNGESWTLRSPLTGCVGKLVVRGTRLLFASYAGVEISDDGGLTWQEKDVVPTNSNRATALVLANNGRLVLGAKGADPQAHGLFYVSDDGGDSWTTRETVTQYGDQIADIARAANGRLIATVQYNPPFYPRLMLSDDNGDTWREDLQLQQLPGLIPIAGGSGPHHGISMRSIERATNGRLFLLGGQSIVTSDDNGNSWTTRISTFYANDVRGGPYWGSESGLVQIGFRWIAPMVYVDRVFGEVANAVLVSDDNGNTWYRILVPTHFTQFSGILAGRNGRAVIFGSRAAVLLSDGEGDPLQPPDHLSVRASDSLDVSVARPPLTGDVHVRYSAVADRDAASSAGAIPNTDFAPSAGVLDWAAGDSSARTISLQTLDNGSNTALDKQLKLQLVTESDTLGGSAQIPVTIRNARRSYDAGIALTNTDGLVIERGGPAVRFRVALTRVPTANVTITLVNGSPAVAGVAPTTLTFTPANWINSQDVVITPTATAGHSIGGSANRIAINASSSDTAYQAISNYFAVYWLDSKLLFDSGFE